MKNKAVFLDRDGVVNFERGTYNCSIDDFIINPDIGNAIRLLKDNNFLVIIISNQAGIAKKLFTNEVVGAMHQKLVDYLAGYGTTVDEFYYCPHHESVTQCLCRKPKPLLIEKALARYCIDAGASWFIGDSKRDSEAAEAAGVTAILIEPNSSLLQVCNNIIEKSIQQ
ncbi:MAG TPA: HAD family hydrolase [Bacteroidales bacterium]|nr:HAD family hydrolase [Bacteroidales bacterium]